MNSERPSLISLNSIPDNLADAQEFIPLVSEPGKAPNPACKCGGCVGGCQSCKCGGGNCQKCKIEEDLEISTI